MAKVNIRKLLIDGIKENGITPYTLVLLKKLLKYKIHFLKKLKEENMRNFGKT